MTIYEKAIQQMAAEDIDHHESDLYLRKNEISDQLVNEYEFKKQVIIFRDSIDRVLWYEIPFQYPIER